MSKRRSPSNTPNSKRRTGSQASNFIVPDGSESEAEILRWQKKWENQSVAEWPSTFLISLKECNQDFFPNVFILLQI